MMTGQNFSLSRDGRRLAVIRGASLDLFDLPTQSSEELAKFSAFKADVPDLYDLAADADPTKPENADTEATSSEAKDASTVLQSSETIAPNSSDSTNPEPQAAPTNPLPIIKVSAKAVAVDVVVTDNKGRPIKGLRPQDFQVTEDGKIQDVRSFREFSDGQATEDPDKENESKVAAEHLLPPNAETPPANVFTNKSHAPELGAVTLVLFDMLNTPSQDQSFARQQLIKYLQSKPKNLQFALCTLNAGGDPHLRLIQGFTPNETVLLAAAKGRRGGSEGSSLANFGRRNIERRRYCRRPGAGWADERISRFVSRFATKPSRAASHRHERSLRHNPRFHDAAGEIPLWHPWPQECCLALRILSHLHCGCEQLG